MAINFIDVPNGHWAHDDILEAANTFLSDGTPLIEGLPYQIFEDGKPYIYQEIVATKNQVQFSLNKTINPTQTNPLYVYIDGVQYGYRKSESKPGKTTVTLNTPVPQGSIVSFMSPGVPKLERGRPITKTEPFYPHYRLRYYVGYSSTTIPGYNEYLTIFGKKLKKIALSQDEYDNATGQDLSRKYIGNKTDVYIIVRGVIHLPFDFEGMTGSITYAFMSNGLKKVTEKFVPWVGSATETAREPYHLNRFFPNTWVSRAEAIELINKLRCYYYEQLTDHKPPGQNLDYEVEAFHGQQVFRLNGHYIAGDGLLKVKQYNEATEKWVTLKNEKDYKEFDNFTVLLKEPVEKGTKLHFTHVKTESAHLYDVGRNIKYHVKSTGKLVSVNGTTDDWVSTVLAIEHEVLNDGSRLINGKNVATFYDPKGQTIPSVADEYYRPVGTGVGRSLFMPHTPITREEMAAFTNRFRKWFLERFL